MFSATCSVGRESQSFLNRRGGPLQRNLKSISIVPLLASPFDRTLVDNFEWAVGYTMRFGLYRWEADGTVDRVLREGSKVLVRLYKSLPDNLEVGGGVGEWFGTSTGQRGGWSGRGCFCVARGPSLQLPRPGPIIGSLAFSQKLKELAIKHRSNHWGDLSSPSTRG